MRQEALTIAGIMGVLALILYWVGQRKLRLKRLIQDVPTSKAAGVCIGLTEVKGDACTDTPLTSYLAEAEVVYYTWSVEEHWRRIETYTDSKGRVRTRVVTGWDTVASGGEQIPFDLTDDSGAVLVEPAGAKVETSTIFFKEVHRGAWLYYGKGPSGSIPYSTHTRRFIESAVCRNARLYVIGSARLRDEVAAPVLRKVDTGDPYIISVRSEEQIVRGKTWGTIFCHIFGLLLTTVAGGVLDTSPVSDFMPEAGFSPRFSHRSSDFGEFLHENWRGLVTGALIYGALLVAGWAWLVHNGLVRLRNRLQSAWSLVDVQLKRRHDLIPNLVNIAKASAAHERELQTLVAQARTAQGDQRHGGTGLNAISAHGQGLVARVVALREAYPALGADANFTRLTDNLIDTENRIALAIQFSNECLTNLRNRMEVVPDNLVVKLTRFAPEKRGWYSAPQAAQAVPQVSVTPPQ